jgi:Protein of unknown function (DUF2971)
MQYIYRFRPKEKCLKEIQEKRFYFSDIPSLNDPMEGVQDIFFTTDPLLWKELINLYFIFLHYTIKNDSNFKDIESFWNDHTLSDKYIKNIPHAAVFSKLLLLLSENIHSILFEKENYRISIEKLLPKFTELGYAIIIYILKVDKDFNENSPLKSLMLYLNINIFSGELSLPPPFDTSSKIGDCLSKLLYIFNIKTESSELNILLAAKMMDNRPTLQYHYVLPKLIIEFLDKLKNILNSDFRILCFSADYSEPLMWSHYAYNHTGVSLIFNLKILQEDLNKTLKDNLIYSEITYTNDLPSLNWFDAVLNLSKDRKDYAKSYITKKITNWSYEQEYRIITNKKDGIVEYSYGALTGIVFGMNTKVKDMVELILEIFKLKNSENFDFYKAYYCKTSNRIKAKKIELEALIKLITLPMNY